MELLLIILSVVAIVVFISFIGTTTQYENKVKTSQKALLNVYKSYKYAYFSVLIMLFIYLINEFLFTPFSQEFLKFYFTFTILLMMLVQILTILLLKKHHQKSLEKERSGRV